MPLLRSATDPCYSLNVSLYSIDERSCVFVNFMFIAFFFPCHLLILKDTLEFPAHELRKHFRIGDHVRVIAGRYEGDTGLVVRVEENLAIVFSDLTMHEVRWRDRVQTLCSKG